MIEKTVEILKTPRNAPTTGKSLVERYASKHLKKLTPGGGGRSKHLATVVRFLEFSVKRCGADPCWSPPDSEDVANLRGYKEDNTKRTIPVKPEQLLILLESLENKPEVRLAVALVGLYGLRPSELRTLQVVDGELRASSTKRNMAEARRPKPPRLLQPLDLKELPGEGERVLRMFESGLVKLPSAILNAKDNKLGGHEFGQQLRRNATWRSLVAATPGLTPYGLRHGYAWRGAKYYDSPVPLRDLADLMGHTLPTHLQYYGQWTTDQDKRASVQRAVESLTKRV
jgi:integrase